MSIYEIEVPTIDGGSTTLEEFRGQLLLIVNTASGCGLAPQFEGLEKLYLEFNEKGFSVLGFPCNCRTSCHPLPINVQYDVSNVRQGKSKWPPNSSSLCFIEKRDNWTFRRKGQMELHKIPRS